IREDDPIALDARIRLLPDPLVERPLTLSLSKGGLAGLLQAPPGPVVQPAVVDAAYSSILQAAVGQVRPPMGAVDPQQPGLAVLVPEHHQILAEQTHGDRSAARGQLRREGGWLPVATHQLATGRA